MEICVRYISLCLMKKIISIQELDTVTFGKDNKKIGEVSPFKYRGYYYDTNAACSKYTYNLYFYTDVRCLHTIMQPVSFLRTLYG